MKNINKKKKLATVNIIALVMGTTSILLPSNVFAAEIKIPLVTLMENSSSSYSSFVINNDVSLYGWGWNGYTQLCNDIDLNGKSPKDISSQLNGMYFTKIASGETHVIATGIDGELYSWGNNYTGELGDNTTISKSIPTKIELASGVKPKKIAIGSGYSMATGTDNNLYTWGCNTFGELGDGTVNNKYSPTKIILSNGVEPIDIACGSHFTLAIGSDNELYTWGNDIVTPTKIALPNNIKPKKIACGNNYAMIIVEDNELYAFGRNEYGQLGYGTTISVLNPFKITLPNGISATQIACGLDHSLMVGSDNELYSWGYNKEGQVGDGTTIDKYTPTKISLPNEIKPKKISCGSYFSMVVGTDDELYVWGGNYNGQLGDGTATNKLIPTKVNF